MDILSALRKVTASIKTWADSKLETKLDKNLGTDNAGKVLTIGDDGDIKSQMLDTGIIVLSGTNDNPINIDEIKVSGTYLIKGVVTTSMDTTSGSDSAKLNKTFIDGFARGELMSIYSFQDGFVNQLMMNPTRPLVRLDSGEGYSDAIDASYVQPVEKTTEMTQPVGIRSDGQLFTEPFNQVQSDWNENDESSLAHVKNRTHYDNRTEEVLLSSSGENVDCSGLIKISDEVMTLDKLKISRIEMSLSVNSINFDNAIFDYDGFVNPSESILGVYYHNEDVHIDLSIIVNSSTTADAGMYLSIDENGTGTYSMKLYGEVGELKTLDPKYIKDMYYTEDKIEQKEIEVYTDEDEIFLPGDSYRNEYESIGLIEGESYDIYVSSRSSGGKGVYELDRTCVCALSSDGQPYLTQTDGKETVAENAYVVYDTYTALNAGYGYNASVYGIKIAGKFGNTIIHPIDAKYLPAEIYTSDPSLGITGAAAGQIAKITTVDDAGKPTVWEPVDIPEALPNPYALTFTGAVTGSYNGSAAVSVEIPGDGYIKPDSGIPKADLSNEVQTSLSKADTALQKHQDISGKVDKVDGKGLSTNDYTNADKSKVDDIPANPKYTDTVYDDTALKNRVSAIEEKESTWDNKSDFSGSYNDLTDKPTIPTVPTKISAFENDSGYLTEHQDISGKQDVITETNKLPYSLLSDTPTIPASASDIGIIEYTATEIDELWDSI